MKRLIPILLWLGALLLIAFALLYFEGDLLWKVQQYNPFFDTSLFLSDKMVVPGGLLSYAGCFFTQFFFHPWLGVLMLCGWWLLLMWLTKRTFRIADSWAVLTLIPVAVLLTANMCLGYWHYFMKLQGYFFAATIGTTVAVAMLWGLRALPQKLWIRIAWVVLAAVIGYPLFGVYALATVGLFIVYSLEFRVYSLGFRRQGGILAVVALLCIVAVPLVGYRYVYYQTNISELWTAGLPVFYVLKSYPLYYIPYYILGGFFLLLAIFEGKKIKSYKGKFKGAPVILQGVLVVVLIAGVWHFWYKDDNFHHELKMQQCIERADWEGVIEESGKLQAEPTRPIVLMRNIALWRTGRQLEEMYNYPRGGAKANTDLPVSMVYHVFGRLIYYQYGLLNDCHRICMEDGVEYGWRVELQKYLTRCSLLSGETQAARKSLNLLRHTLYHKAWAEEMLQLADHREKMAENRETGPITHMLHYRSALGSDGGNVERYIMSELASQDADDPYFQEQAVLGAMWMKDARLFMARFGHYARQHTNGPMPRIFQEAAYLLGKRENRQDIDRFPFDENVKKTYQTFMKQSTAYENQAIGSGRTALYPFYGNTYYYEYFYSKYSY